MASHFPTARKRHRASEMGIRIKERQACFIHEDSYTVYLPRRNHIAVTVTAAPYVVRSWVYRTRRLHSFRHHKLVVGLRVQWRPNTGYIPHSRVATLQLCVDHRCLIFLILHSRSIPRSLRTFLAYTCATFVGVHNPVDVIYLYCHDPNLGLLTTLI
ncbi:hypothetical protein ACLOJK_026577 [Asimina triloba]